MTEIRPPIPTSLERDLMIESGYRCALCSVVEPLEIEHIEEFSAVKEHTFENMIVLCANCHRRKKSSSDPRHINKISLKKIKQNLILLNGRYSDLEKRILDNFKEQILSGNVEPLFVNSHLKILIIKLINDRVISYKTYQGGM
jgi:hypothetical protein